MTLSSLAELKIQPELNSKLIPPHCRNDLGGTGGGVGGGSGDCSEGAAAASVNEN